MGVKIRMAVGFWLISLLPIALAASGTGDLRLVEAVKHREQDTVRSLLKQHVDVNVSQADGATALAWAADRDDLETAQLLIGAGANVNAANDYGVTPLSLACTNGDGAMVEILLKAGAKPNIAQWSGETPLMSCARPGNLEAVRALVEHGADVNAQTRRGQTALMWAVAEKHSEVARLLIEHGANVNAKSHMLEGFTPLLHIDFGKYDRDPGKRERKVDATGGHRDPATSKGGFTALIFAAQVGDLESAQLLVTAGANLNEASAENGTALVMAIASGHEELAKFLVDKGADPNVADVYGFTPLHYALHDGIKAITFSRPTMSTDNRAWFRPSMPELVKPLLEHGANPNARVGKGYPVLDTMVYGRGPHDRMPQIKQPGVTPFFLAAASDDAKLMRALVAGGADPLLATEEGVTPLMVATGGFLGRVADRTPAQEASALETVKLAVELGANVNAADKLGRTALQGAAFLGENSIIQFLVDKGADLEFKDRYGQTAMSIATGDALALKQYAYEDHFDDRVRNPTRHPNSVALLLKLGAKPMEPAAEANPSGSPSAE